MAAFGMHVVATRPFVFAFGMQLAVVAMVAVPLAPLSSSSFVAGVCLVAAAKNIMFHNIVHVVLKCCIRI